MTRCVFMGTPEFAVPSLAALLAAGYDVVGVLTKEDQPAGRGQKLEASAVKQLAQAHGLTIQQPSTLRTAEAQAALAGLAPDVIVVAAYGLILPQEVLDLPRFGCINVHGSVLPRWRGAAPIAAAILAGDVEAGVSIMRMDAGVDTGPMLSAAYLPIAADDTTGTLTPKLASVGGRSAGADAAALAGRRARRHPAAGGGRHLGPAHHQGRRADRLDRAGSADRAPRARLPALADGVHALEWAGVEGSAGAGGGGTRDQGSGIRSQGARNDHRGQSWKRRRGDEAWACCGWRRSNWPANGPRRSARFCRGRGDSWGASCHRDAAFQTESLRSEAVGLPRLFAHSTRSKRLPSRMIVLIHNCHRFPLN